MFGFSEEVNKLAYQVLRKYPDLLEYIRDQKYRINETGMSYRQVNSLDQVGLLNDTRKSDKNWRHFSLNDLFYLHVITQTRAFNTNNAQLEYLKKLFYSQTINYSKIGKVHTSEIALVALFTGLVPIGLVFYSDGEAVFTDNTEAAFVPIFKDIKDRKYIFFLLHESFKGRIEKTKQELLFQSKFDLKQFENDYSVRSITRKQRALLNILDNNNYSQITITKKADGGLLIKGENNVKGAKLTPEDVLKIFEQKEFGDIKVHKRKGEIASVRSTDVYKI